MWPRLIFAVCITVGLAGADAASTKQLFVEKCSVCHGADAGGSDRGPALAGNRRLRTRSVTDIANVIKSGTPGGMPAIPLSEEQLSPLADYVRSLNATAFETRPAGDAAAGERFFYGAGHCNSCHPSTGPDLSNIGRQLTLPELEQSLTDPGARIAPGYSTASVTLNDGKMLRGLARARGNHDLVLQTADGQLHMLTDKQYKTIKTEAGSMMPALHSTPEEQRNLVAWLARLDGTKEGPLTGDLPANPAEFDAILHPKSGEWPTYYGNLSGHRYSSLD
jgi:putative heme-binding domain-containing protein